jgi:putative flippase GtrA
MNPHTAPGQGIRIFQNERIIGFFLIGIVSSAVDIGLLFIFTVCLGIWYLISTTLSYGSGIAVSYILNKYLTFHDADRHYVAQFTAFAAISISCLLVNLCIIWLAVELFFMGYLPAKVIATCCAFLWNYYGQSRFTFHERRFP